MQNSIKYWRFFAYKKTILLLVTLITVFFALQLNRLQTNFDFNPIVSQTQPGPIEQQFNNHLTTKTQINHASNTTSNTIHTSQIIIVAHDKRLFTPKILATLKQFSNALSNSPHVADVTSLYNLQDITQSLYLNKIQPMLSGGETSTEELAYAKQYSINNRLYLGKFINPTGTALAFHVTVNWQDKAELYQTRDKIEQIIQQFQPKLTALYQISGVELENYFFEATKHDSLILGSTALILLALVYGLFFSNLIIGLLPLLTSAIALIWTAGILVYLGVPINALSSIILILVFTIGAMECAHFIHMYQSSVNQEQEQEPSQSHISFQTNLTSVSSIKHIIFSTRTVFPAFIFASVTTVLGFASNLFASIAFLQDFAITITIAILLNALLITIILPMLLSWVIHRARSKQGNKLFESIQYRVIKLYRYNNNHPKLIWALIITVILFTLLVTPKIPIEVTPYINFYSDSSVMQKIHAVKHDISGTEQLTIYFAADHPDAFKQYQTLQTLSNAEQAIAALPETTSTLSVANVIATLFALYTDNMTNTDYAVPDAPMFINSAFDLIQQKLPLTGALTSDEARLAKLYIIYQSYSSQQLLHYITQIKQVLTETLRNSNLRYEITNTLIQQLQQIRQIIRLQLISIALIYLIVFSLISIAFRSIRAGIMAVLPNLFPLANVLLLMYCLNIPFFPMSILVLAGIVGLAVDNTVHLMLSFRNLIKAQLPIDRAMTLAIKKQFTPVTVTSISFILAMGILSFSNLKGIMLFAILLIFGTFVAWLSDIILTPFLLARCVITKKTV